MSRLFNRKSAVIATVFALIAAGGAYAYWTQLGTGSGSAATSATGQSVTVNQTSAPSNLSPGSGPQPLAGDFTNPNSGGVWVGTITASLFSVTNGNGGTPGDPTDDCTVADYLITDAVIDYDDEIPAVEDPLVTWSGPSIEMRDRSGVNQNACKSATVNIHYTIS